MKRRIKKASDRKIKEKTYTKMTNKMRFDVYTKSVLHKKLGLVKKPSIE